MEDKRMTKKQLTNIRKRLRKSIDWDCIATQLSLSDDTAAEVEFYEKAARDVKRLLNEIDCLNKELNRKTSGAVILGPRS